MPESTISHRITPSGPGLSGFTKDQIVEMVKVRMDEVDHDVIVDVLSADDNYSVNAIIRNVIDDCRLQTLSEAKLVDLPVASKAYAAYAAGATDVKLAENLYAGQFELPADYLRMASFRCSDWDMDVISPVSLDSREVAMQSYEYTRASHANPAVAPIDGASILAFPYENSGAAYPTATLNYISSRTGYEQLGPKAVEALVWITASKAFAALGMLDNAKVCATYYEGEIK